MSRCTIIGSGALSVQLSPDEDFPMGHDRDRPATGLFEEAPKRREDTLRVAHVVLSFIEPTLGQGPPRC